MKTIANAECQIWLNERLGGEIFRITFRGQDLLASYDWASPVPADQSRSYGDAKLDWLSEYRGGWQLLVPNAGAACTVLGVPLPFHGEWSRTRVNTVHHDDTGIVMTAGTRLALDVEREVRVESNPTRVVVRTSVTNRAATPMPFVWGEHPAFAAAHGDRIDIPSVTVLAVDGSPIGAWPRGSRGRTLDVVDDSEALESVHFLTNFNEGWAALRRTNHGVALAWDVGDFPYAWLWHEIRSPGFPFYERTSLVAIEPASSWGGHGLGDAISRGQAFHLEPNHTRSTTLALIPFIADDRPVVGARVDGTLYFGPAAPGAL